MSCTAITKQLCLKLFYHLAACWELAWNMHSVLLWNSKLQKISVAAAQYRMRAVEEKNYCCTALHNIYTELQDYVETCFSWNKRLLYYFQCFMLSKLQSSYVSSLHCCATSVICGLNMCGTKMFQFMLASLLSETFWREKNLSVSPALSFKQCLYSRKWQCLYYFNLKTAHEPFYQYMRRSMLKSTSIMVIKKIFISNF